MTGPRRVDVEVVKTEPLSFEEWHQSTRHRDADDYNRAYMAKRGRDYQEYREDHQPYHWRAKAGNNETIAQGENYFHAADAADTVRLLADPATTVTLTVDGETEVLREGQLGAQVRVVQAAIIRSMNYVGELVVGTNWTPITSSPISDYQVAQILSAPLDQADADCDEGGAR